MAPPVTDVYGRGAEGAMTLHGPPGAALCHKHVPSSTSPGDCDCEKIELLWTHYPAKFMHPVYDAHFSSLC